MSKLEIHPKMVSILDALSRKCQFNNNVDVLNECFGANRNIYMHACYPQKRDEFIWEINTNDKIIVWMPKLYGNSSKWKNSISDDGTVIYEIDEEDRTTDWMDVGKHDLSVIRLVFVKPKAREPYVFVGAFVNGIMNHLNHTYLRIATKVRLIGDPVDKVELLDDSRKITSLNDNKKVNRNSFINSLVLPKGFEAKQYNGMNRVHLKYKSVGFAVFNMNKNTYNLATRKEVYKAINVNDYSYEKNLGPNDAIIKGIPYSDTTVLYRLIDYISLFDDASDAFDKHYLISRKEVEASEEEESHIQKELDELISLEKEFGDGYEYKARPEQRKNIDDTDKKTGVSTYPRDRQKRINALKRAKYTCEFNPEHKSFISKKTDMRYMETHHLVPLEYWKDFNNSLDVEANIVCLCSNCHNEIHYGKYADKLIEPLYKKRKKELEAAGIVIDLDDLLDMYNGTRIDNTELDG